MRKKSRRSKTASILDSTSTQTRTPSLDEYNFAMQSFLENTSPRTSSISPNSFARTRTKWICGHAWMMLLVIVVVIGYRHNLQKLRWEKVRCTNQSSGWRCKNLLMNVASCKKFWNMRWILLLTLWWLGSVTGQVGTNWLAKNIVQILPKTIRAKVSSGYRRIATIQLFYKVFGHGIEEVVKPEVQLPTSQVWRSSTCIFVWLCFWDMLTVDASWIGGVWGRFWSGKSIVLNTEL